MKSPRDYRIPRLGLMLLVTVMVAATAGAPLGGPADAQQDPRYFGDTGFRIDNDVIWDYFSKRGKIRTFGPPTSRTFQFLGASTQFFQRQVVQAIPSGVQTLNLLDEGLLPYTTINGSTFPGVDATLVASAPSAGSSGYDTAVVDHIRRNAPDTFEGEPVKFFETFSQTVSLADAFPTGGGNPALLPLLNLELWGLPTSRPTRDPSNNNFVYQRFQRGIMHYDAGCRCTQGLLLADYLKALITGENLPDDLAAQAVESAFFAQYDPRSHSGPLRSGALPATDLTNAFRPSLDTTTAVAAPREVAATATPRRETTVAASTPTSPPATRAATQAPSVAGPTATSRPGGAGPTATPNRSGRSATPAPATPTPVPGPIPFGFPDGIVVKLNEAGKNAKQDEQKQHADGRENWYSVRYERPRTYAGYRSGPVTIFSKAWVLHDVGAAREVFQQQVAVIDKFPEAKDRVGDLFEFNTEVQGWDLGDEIQARSACVGNCGREADLYLHRRLVMRVDNMVGVLYTYGLDDPEGNTEDNTRLFASYMIRRMRE